MSDGMFRTVSGFKQGYDPDEVDDFFAHARAVYETGPASALASKDVRGVAFDMVRGGYVTAGGRRGARPAGGRVRGPVPCRSSSRRGVSRGGWST